MLKPPLDLVSAAASGDAKSMEMLLELLWPEAYRIARSILSGRAAAEDAAQEACARASMTITTLKRPEGFSVWFYRIVANEAISQFRKLRRMDQTYFDAGDSADSDAHEDRLDVRRAIVALPAHLRATIVLFYYADLTTSEIAAVMSINPVAVRLRLMIARRRLRSLLVEKTPDSRSQSKKGAVCSHEQERA
jgi:RNA polymerase sigma-70 factor (ECF subfamily)